MAIDFVWHCHMGRDSGAPEKPSQSAALLMAGGVGQIPHSVCAVGEPWEPHGLPVRMIKRAKQMEPGVFGVLRPVLLLPEGINERLSAAELQSVIAHERCHIRRRDNSATAIHMFVEAIFWFHPLVWWIKARLIHEQERACDEEVLTRGVDPQVYAESILKICKLYVDSPLACVAGIAGSNLKHRIENIMRCRIGLRLGFARATLLTLGAIVALVSPVVVGMVQARVARPEVQLPSIAIPPLNFIREQARAQASPEHWRRRKVGVPAANSLLRSSRRRSRKQCRQRLFTEPGKSKTQPMS